MFKQLLICATPSPRDWRGESAAAGHSRAQDGGARRRFRHDRAHVQSTGGCHERPFGSGAFLAAGPTGDWLAFATNCDIERIFGSSRSVIHGFRVEAKRVNPHPLSTSTSFPKVPGPLQPTTRSVITRLPCTDDRAWSST